MVPMLINVLLVLLLTFCKEQFANQLAMKDSLKTIPLRFVKLAILIVPLVMVLQLLIVYLVVVLDIFKEQLV